MMIQIERLSAQSIRRVAQRCTAPQCNAAATWILVDRDMPQSHAANSGELVSCTAHISVTYLSLRGAQVVARGAFTDRVTTLRPGVLERRRQKHTLMRASIPKLPAARV